MADHEDHEEEVMDLTNPEAVARYRMASDIANRAIEKVAQECNAGRKLVDLCKIGDDFINAEVSKVLVAESKKEKIEKGVAFPTCIAANHCCGHFSPLSADKTIINANDIVKIDLGVQVDGYIVVCAKTVVVSPSAEIPATTANVISAARVAFDAVCGMLRPGKTNAEISEVIKRVAEAYHVKPLEGVLSHQMKRFVIDGSKVIMNHPTQDQKVEQCEIEPNDIWAIDIVMSTGEGKPKEQDVRTTIFKRSVDQQYLLKLKASRYILREVTNRFPTFPFTLRALDEKQGRLGITEMLQHGMVDPYPVLFEHPGNVVAQFKATVFVFADHNEVLYEPQMPSGVHSLLTCEDALVKAALAGKSSGSSATSQIPSTTATAPSSTPTNSNPAPMEM